METKNQKKLRILHLGADPEFNSPVRFEDYIAEINSFDNAFSIIQWTVSNGLPDAIVCENELPAGNGLDFFNFWINQFDPQHNIPFILLGEDEYQLLEASGWQKTADGFLTKLNKPEILISKVLVLKKNIQDMKSSGKSDGFPVFKYRISFTKRLLDLFFGLIGLLVTLPFMVLIMLAIRFESRGKAFYATKRVGTGYQVFNFYKFRSTYLHPDSKVKELSQHNPNPKITKVGQFIRKFSLDELPQVINLLRGDISLVGNRPLALFDAEMLTTNDWLKRLNTPAGITGLWKIEPRRNWKKLSLDERKALDNSYHEIASGSFSFRADLRIILRTIPVILRRRNQN